ncbi:unnamed protein product [Aphanomyces euteiches]
MERWKCSRGFIVQPGLVDSNAKRFELPDVDVDMAKIVVPSDPDESSSDKSEKRSNPDSDEDLSDARSADETCEVGDLQDGSGEDGAHDPEP